VSERSFEALIIATREDVAIAREIRQLIATEGEEGAQL